VHTVNQSYPITEAFPGCCRNFLEAGENKRKE